MKFPRNDLINESFTFLSFFYTNIINEKKKKKSTLFNIQNLTFINSELPVKNF